MKLQTTGLIFFRGGKKYFFSVLLFFVCNPLLQAQSNNNSASDSIAYKRAFFPIIVKYYNNGDRIRKRKVKEMLKLNPNSEVYFQKYKKAKTAAIVSLIPSSIMVSYVAVKVLTYETVSAILLPFPTDRYRLTSADKVLLIGGTAGIIFSALKMYKSDNFFKKAIKQFNNGNGKTSKVDLRFGILNSGNIGVKMIMVM